MAIKKHRSQVVTNAAGDAAISRLARITAVRFGRQFVLQAQHDLARATPANRVWAAGALTSFEQSLRSHEARLSEDELAEV